VGRNRLGRSDFFVSGIRLGVMTFGVGANKKTAFRFIDKAFDVASDFLISQKCILYHQNLAKSGLYAYARFDLRQVG
jgi:hypothetical protein